MFICVILKNNVIRPIDTKKPHGHGRKYCMAIVTGMKIASKHNSVFIIGFKVSSMVYLYLYFVVAFYKLSVMPHLAQTPLIDLP